MSGNFQILQGDNRKTLQNLADESIDSIVTDPPYGINFLNKDWDADTGTLETYQECLRVLKPGGYILAFSAARTYHHLAVILEQAGFEIRDQLMWLYSSGFPKAQDIGKMADSKILKGSASTRAQRQTTMGDEYTEVGHYTIHSGDKESELAKSSNKTDRGADWHAKTAEGAQWAGWKTALKPAHEPIALARKPFTTSCVENVLTHGVGALNIDATRIKWDDNRGGKSFNKGYTSGVKGIGGAQSTKDDEALNHIWSEQGRFPSNVIGEVEPGYQKHFYCPKTNRKERHTGFDMPPPLFGNVHGFYDENGDRYAVGFDKNEAHAGNNHPTVKPVDLMRYLVKLVTPQGGTVLDPFCGSGSTGMAAVELGYEFIGCELDPNYKTIAETRIAAWKTQQEPSSVFQSLFEEGD